MTTSTTEKPQTRIYKLLHGKHKRKLDKTEHGKPLYEEFNALDKNRCMIESDVDLCQKFKNKFAYADAMIVGGQNGVITIEAAEEAKAIALADSAQKNKELQEEIDRLNAKKNGETVTTSTKEPEEKTENTSDNGNTEAPNVAQNIYDGLDLATLKAPFSLESSGRGQWNIDDDDGNQVLKEPVTKEVAAKILVLINKESKA